MENTTDVDVDVFGAQHNQDRFDDIPPSQADLWLLSPRSYDQLLHLGEPEPWSQALPSVPEEEEVTDRVEGLRSVGVDSIRSITSEVHSDEPPTKKQRIHCTACKEGFNAKKSLYRHQRGCKKHCAESNVPPASFWCDECGQNFSRLDILRRHVKSSHQGQLRRMQQGSEVTTQQTFFDTVKPSQRSESQLHSTHSTQKHACNAVFSAFPGMDPTGCYSNVAPTSNTRNTIAPGLATAGYQAKTDSQALTTPAAVPDLQSFEHVKVSSGFDCTSDQSNIDHEMTSISALSDQLTPAISKLSTASSVHEVASTTDREIDDDARLVADAALVAAMEQKLSLREVPYASAKPVSQGRNLGFRSIRNPTPCPLCGDEFGNGPNDNGSVKMNLEKHKKRMEAITYNTVDDSEAVCTDCQIHFLNTRDLRRHQESVRTGEGCGFLFDHCGGHCTGHHPENGDHYRFKEALRRWERFQRRAFEKYVNDYAEGMAPTNAPSYESGRATFRGSTGSIYSASFLGNTERNLSTPVRFCYGGEVELENTPVTTSDPGIRLRALVRRLSEALTDGNSEVVRSICFERPRFSLHAVPTFNEFYLKMDASWFQADLKIELVKCLAAMVEQGLSISSFSVGHLVTVLDGAAAGPLLFAENSPLTAQSRLVQYAFLCAVSRGCLGLVSKLLSHGILYAPSRMPDPDFIRGLHGIRFEDKLCIDSSSSELGPCALVLALSTRQYRTASLLIEHHVAPHWAIDHWSRMRSSLRNLKSEIHVFRQQAKILPHHLYLLEQELLLDLMPDENSGWRRWRSIHTAAYL
jgi:hypothetical protein